MKRGGRTGIVLISIVVWAVLADTGHGRSRGTGRYSGTVIFDRWQACHLYGGRSVMYISERAKSSIMEYIGESIEVDASKVFQYPKSPWGRIDALNYLGKAADAPARYKHVQAVGIRLEAKPTFEEVTGLLGGVRNIGSGGEDRGDPPKVLMTITNAANHQVTLYRNNLAMTLFVNKGPDLTGLFTSDGPSCVFLTTKFVGRSGPKWRSRGTSRGHKFAWTIGRENALPNQLILKEGGKKEITVTFTLPKGEYEFLFGYGGQENDFWCITSNPVAFDVSSKGKARRASVADEDE